jgi:uncharacterized protein (TIGR02147 family)
MSIYEYQDYKPYVNDWIEVQPKAGHGQLRRLAEFLNVNSVVMSQVFRGNRDLSPEQAMGVAKFIGLAESERNYLLLLVQKARAGTKELADAFRKQIEQIQKQSRSLKNRIKHSKFTEQGGATFYSNWYYSAIRLGVSVESLSSAVAIADHLGLERSLATKVIAFLLENQLIVERNDKFDLGPQVTHVGHDSPFVNRHHSNWRLQGLKAMERTAEDEIFYTGPMALSHEAANEIRKDIVGLIERSTKRAAESKSERLSCLNVDWFRI